MLDDFLRLSMLFDFYGALLTKKQQECLKMHLYQDLSLSEIAAVLNISRQAAFDMLHRCETILENYEAQLHAAKKDKAIKNALKDILADLESYKNSIQNLPIKKLDNAEEKIKLLLNS